MFFFYFNQKLRRNSNRVYLAFRINTNSQRSLIEKTDNCTPHFTKATKRDTNRRWKKNGTELSINQSIREAFCIILSITHQLKIQYVNGQLYKNEIVLKENVFGYVERTKKRETNYADQLYFAVIRSNRCKSESNYYSVRKVCEWKENKCNVQEKRPVLIRNRINLNHLISSSFFISVFFFLFHFVDRVQHWQLVSRERMLYWIFSWN